MKSGGEAKPDISKIVVYSFGKPDIVLTPMGYYDEDMIFSAPQLTPTDYLMDLSRGQMKQLLSQTYDQ